LKIIFNIESGSSANILWDEVIKKEARGTDDYDLGEVQQISSEDVITQKGIDSTKWYQIPKRLAEEFDGNKLVLKITEEEAELFYASADSPPELDEEESETTHT
jgi:hypothetical protein